MFGNGAETSLISGLTDRVSISTIFFNNSGLVAASLMGIILLWGIFMLVKHCSNQTDS